MSHIPEVRNGGGLDEEVFECVLFEAGRVCGLQLFVWSFDEDTRSGAILRPTLLKNTVHESVRPVRGS